MSNLLLYFFRSYARAGLGVAPNKPEANPTAPILAALRRDTHPKTPSELTASREEARDAGPGRTNAVAETRRHPPSHKVVLIGSRTLSALRDLDPNPSGLALGAQFGGAERVRYDPNMGLRGHGQRHDVPPAKCK